MELGKRLLKEIFEDRGLMTDLQRALEIDELQDKFDDIERANL